MYPARDLLEIVEGGVGRTNQEASRNDAADPGFASAW
jgi:hypothetical protein